MRSRTFIPPIFKRKWSCNCRTALKSAAHRTIAFYVKTANGKTSSMTLIQLSSKGFAEGKRCGSIKMAAFRKFR